MHAPVDTQVDKDGALGRRELCAGTRLRCLQSRLSSDGGLFTPECCLGLAHLRRFGLNLHALGGGTVVCAARETAVTPRPDYRARGPGLELRRGRGSTQPYPAWRKPAARISNGASSEKLAISMTSATNTIESPA